MKHNSHNSHNSYNHYIVMFVIMIIAGLLSTMNVWVDKYQDIRYSMNDVYMILLMAGWMLFFMGLFNKDLVPCLLGLIIAIISIWCIRNQFLINESQYKMGMIPHHSMAIHMSKKLLEKKNKIKPFLENIITTQENEIDFMKQKNANI
jgi:hypothetical protein